MMLLVELLVSVVSALSYLLLWFIGGVRTILFYRRRSGLKPRHFNPNFAEGLEWEMTMFLVHLFLIGVAPLLLRYAALYLGRVDLRLCWRNTKGAFGALVPKWQVHDDRLPDDLPRRFSFRELKAATGGFSDKNVLGKGSFGVVYRGIMGNGNMIAVKRLINLSVAGSIQDEQWQFENEARLLMLRHGNIVRLVGYCCEREHRLLCYDYMANRSLDNFLFRNRCSTLDWAARHKIIKGICCGLRYLHEECKLDKNMLHLDIKPSNILLDENMNPKISDFGLSRLFDRGSTQTISNVIAPVGYSAPEYLYSGKVSEKTDIFGLGILLLEIAIDRHNQSFDRTPENDEFIIYAKRLASGKEPAPAYVKDEHLVQFRNCTKIGLMCVRSEKERPTAGDVMNRINGR